MTPRKRAAGSPAARLLAQPRLSEATLDATVFDIVHLHGGLVAHFRPAIAGFGRDGQPRWRTAVAADGKGFPDLVIVLPGGVMFREDKRDGQKPTPDQRMWLDRLDAAGADADVWTEADLRSGRILSEIRALRTPRGTIL